ncbi:uncharacterized protein LOC133847052 [Drosophila sulfurigaster albostrigata]|uniref:uncharacterized protein LOC133847052 n=1 Tax=Drosophila sulfurigaster albostrigata TaxID=89887 RepID=UPI002D21AAA4|nr:uncharacterized protein LOC133847052 [Drosophila sulfurigaster albostrigata]
MGVCRFFQQGSCRFGTKCRNEHFDVKQYLKTDMEACINSNMWRFSVYGPFKDKPSIPNFIEDQSFEEVRLQAYESRSQNRFDQFHQQYTNQVHETVNKMKAMLQMTPQIIDVMIKIYEAPEGAQVTATNNSNPFSFADNNATQQQAGSIFGKPALGASSGNIFGGPAAAPPAAGNIFGGGSVNNAATNNNIFGGANSTNIFGQPQQQQQPQPAAFGQQQPNPFGQPQQQPSIFAQQPQQQQQQMNPFGQPATAARSFSFAQPTQATNPSPFGQSNAFLPQQQQQQQGGVFAQAVSAAAVPNTGNIFAQATQQQQQQPPNGFFGQAATATGFPPAQQVQMQQAAPQQQQQQQLQQQQPSDSSIYSRMEDLTAEEIAAFKAEAFAPGQVPLNPPPRELCL